MSPPAGDVRIPWDEPAESTPEDVDRPPRQDDVWDQLPIEERGRDVDSEWHVEHSR